MQRNSIHNPAPTENAQTQNPFPTSGNNFTTLVSLDGFPDDVTALEALAFLDDFAIALAAFEASEHYKGTPSSNRSIQSYGDNFRRNKVVFVLKILKFLQK